MALARPGRSPGVGRARGSLCGRVRVDSRGWGAWPPPWVLAHFVCAAFPGSDGREQAMRAWGYWREDAIAKALPSGLALHTSRIAQVHSGMIGERPRTLMAP